jgi:Arc/MetJ-type ribon-helix-helix transcriptional regulator
MKHAYPPDVEQFLLEALQTGEYASEDDVLFEAVRTLREVKRKHQSLRDDIRAAIDQLENGHGEPWDVDELKAGLARELDSGSAAP